MLAAKTLFRLRKYGIRDMSTLDYYVLKPVYVPEHIKIQNKRLYSTLKVESDQEWTGSYGDFSGVYNPADSGICCYDFF